MKRAKVVWRDPFDPDKIVELGELDQYLAKIEQLTPTPEVIRRVHLIGIVQIKLPELKERHYERWFVVREARLAKLSDADANERASQELANTPYACSPETMGRSFDLIDKNERLPSYLRISRTRKPRRPWA
jgi:hypothetical protein